MPGNVRSASLNVFTLVSSISCFEITETDFGVFNRGATNLELADLSTLRLCATSASA